MCAVSRISSQAVYLIAALNIRSLGLGWIELHYVSAEPTCGPRLVALGIEATGRFVFGKDPV